MQPAHTPVLLDEALAWLAPGRGGVYCDATVGLGGHAEKILEQFPIDMLIGLDRDPEALASAANRLGRFGDRVTLLHRPFSEIRDALAGIGVAAVDGILADLGVSSLQLDRADRGFSFRADGPLDMRMDPTSGETAQSLLQRVAERELEVILHDLGEERFARRIARAIVADREAGGAALASTRSLAALVARVVPARERHRDPATRTFQALRLAVNRELDELDRFLDAAAECLAPSGRLVVIAFHSLEDRMVKHRFRAWSVEGHRPRFEVLTRKPVVPGDGEVAGNPRARSAKLRATARLA